MQQLAAFEQDGGAGRGVRHADEVGQEGVEEEEALGARCVRRRGERTELVYVDAFGGEGGGGGKVEV